VVYREESPSGRLTLTANNAAYDAGPNLFSFSDPEGAHLYYSENSTEGAGVVESRTRADGFRVDADRGELSAAGGVQTIFSRPGKEPVLIQAESLVLDSGVKSLSYAGNPRILRQSYLIQGKLIRLDSVGERLEVQDVDSTFWEPGGDSDRRCRIQAPELVYERSSGKAAYRGGVRMQSGDFKVESSQLDLLLDDSPSSTIQSIAAGGEVEIREGHRWARGDRAVYHPQEGRVELTGELAEVVEPLRGSASGRRVTLFVGTDKIVIDQPASLPAP
jgi:lipopolysaccharide export system protein LptA